MAKGNGKSGGRSQEKPENKREHKAVARTEREINKAQGRNRDK